MTNNKKPADRKTDVLRFRCTPGERRKLEQAAKEERITLSAKLRAIFRKWLDRRKRGG